PSDRGRWTMWCRFPRRPSQETADGQGGDDRRPRNRALGHTDRFAGEGGRGPGLLPRTAWVRWVPPTLEPAPSDGIAVCVVGRDTGRHVSIGDPPGTIGRMRSIRGCVEPTGVHLW